MSTNSIKSDALEPTRAELRGASVGQKVGRLLPVYGLPVLTVALILLFSALLPQTFPTLLNLRSIIADKAIIALLSLAAMIPMATGKIDLTVGYGIVLWHILAITLQAFYGLPWPVAVAIVLVLGLLVGFVNGVLVEVARIDSFIATLGTGTVLYALALWHTNGRQVVAVLPEGFLALNGTRLLGLPVTGYYVLGLALVMWFVFEYLPVGRYMYAIGANPKAAALNGIPVERYTMLAFGLSGLLTAGAGVLLASKLRIGQASVGLEFLLPALVGAFLGSTTIKPGRVNVWGTVIGVVILATGISGIQQFGGSFWVEPLFNGLTLLVAIGIAGYAQRRRAAGRTAPIGNRTPNAGSPQGEKA
ncbi:ABC transporter permease [Lichenihabitans sp. Uapishka_5]|uniref:ABC transporter permease n=1 Tax=Lichenihabitans sp. Uapishka_5 TaxID=3037302 RepID=UPI0029E7FA47|nr:ABC transporter permease [Lichenihabitans sp. Uapishka_5]MDX7953024.1 ABC transporter permease [Lichenihabitans sp. Uapishka_5]